MDEQVSTRESSSRSAGEGERRYRQMFEIAPVALCEVDLSAVKALFEPRKRSASSTPSSRGECASVRRNWKR